jgi:uncharacterized membrane protein YbhN (UPF0104 family)
VKKRRSDVAKYLRSAVSIAVLGWLAWRINWSQVNQCFTEIRWKWWLSATVLYVAVQILSALRWQLLAKPLGFADAQPRFIRLYFVGMFFNLFLPSSVGGDVVRAWYLNGRSGRAMAAAVSVFIDRFSGLLVLLALAVVGSLVCSVDLPVWVNQSVWGTAACAALGLLLFPLASRWFGHLESVRKLVDGLAYLATRPGLVMGTTFLSVLVQAGNVIVLWLVGVAMTLSVPLQYYWIMVPMVTLVTLVPISLNGMGIREAGLVVFLTPFGVGQASAVSMAFLWFSVLTAASLVGGVIYLFGSLPRLERQEDDGLIGDNPGQGRAGQSRAAA